MRGFWPAAGPILRSGSRDRPERWDRRPGGPRSTHRGRGRAAERKIRPVRPLHGSDRAGRNCAPSPSCSSASKPEANKKQKQNGGGPGRDRLGGGIRVPLHLHREVEWASFCFVLSASCGLFFFVVCLFVVFGSFGCGVLFFVALLFSGLSVGWQLRVVLFCGWSFFVVACCFLWLAFALVCGGHA